MSAEVTFDPKSGLYGISITTAQGWPNASGFSIRFSGQQSLTISTTRHVIEGNTLTVTDRGFGNVLNGLAENDVATAFTESAAATFSLQGARDSVAEFRACVAAPSV